MENKRRPHPSWLFGYRAHGGVEHRPVRNYLFYHPENSTTHWLFDDDTSVITSMHEVVEMRIDQRSKQVTGFLFTTREGRYFAMKIATDFAASEIDELPILD